MENEKPKKLLAPEIVVAETSSGRTLVDIRQGVKHVAFYISGKGLSILKAKLANVSHKHN